MSSRVKWRIVVLDSLEAHTSSAGGAERDNAVSDQVPQKGEGMSIRFWFLILYVAYSLSSGRLSQQQGGALPAKQGSGWDPSGLSSPPPTGRTPPPPPATTDTGGGLDPWG